ncbi:hypothetical protein AYI70_g8184 [Smittium culicis]|uniref:Interferon-related developmental regulator N-terminal domain-containing protein n=1 Tax=Smittium culicis TaxID=133412 RepID=A0A1R1XAZ6_9FUNG|nr:hypothetical protein AYI70_g9485 [Smittium culicis]OMJ13956.1 hypothetical protein AYI70_g8184 [Smittium culicis]
MMSLNAYGLMMTVLGSSNSDSAKQIFEKDFDIHYELLSCDDVDVRVASSENIALMYELLTDYSNEDQSDYESDDYDSDSDYESHASKSSSHNHGLDLGLASYDHDELVDVLVEMSRDSNKKHNKKDKQQQKQALRLVVSSVAGSSNPSIKMNLKNHIVRFSSWTKICRLNAFKTICSNGLYMHFVENPILHPIFGSSINSLVASGIGGHSNSGNHDERVVVDSKSDMAKYRSMNMKKMRSSKNINSFD